jgi:hypothetical protein
MRFTFKFVRKRQIVEAGELTIDIESLDEKTIKDKLARLDFSTFIIKDVEPAAPDVWDFQPMVIKNNNDNNRPKPTAA